MIERLKINVDNWKEHGYYLAMNNSFERYAEIRDENDLILDRTGWIIIEYPIIGNYSPEEKVTYKLWYLNGIRTTASVVWDTLTEEERAETIWELDQWK